MRIIIGGTEVATPSSIKHGFFDITKSDRTASGVMVIDIVRKNVRRKDVTWNMLTDSAYRQILDTITANKPIANVQFIEGGRTETMMCYFGDILATTDYALWDNVNGVRYWREFQFPFIEV